jgi:hypothetical protein
MSILKTRAKGVQELKFMLNKCLSYFVILKLRHKSLSLVFPVPLFIFADLLRALYDLILLWEHIFPRLQLLRLTIDQITLLLVELRRLGRWTLVEFADNENKLYISFY